MGKVLVTGSAGFIGGYVVEELLGRGYAVVGIDNYSKYGPVAKSYDDHPDYRLIEGDVRDVELMTDLLADCDHFIAGAAMIGGISYFHTYAYDLLATNERIIAASCDAAIAALHERAAAEGHLHELVDGVRVRPNVAVARRATSGEIPPPLSSYGFQKLAVEYFARAAWDQYGLPYTIVRPVQLRRHRRGPRAGRRRDRFSGNVKLAMSHVVPDLVQKVAQGPGPAAHPRRRQPGPALHLRRRPGPRHRRPRWSTRRRSNDDFNLSTARVHDRARARRDHLAQDQRAGRAAAARARRRRSSTTCSAGSRDGQGPRGARLRGHHHPRRRCSTRSSRGFGVPLRTGSCERGQLRRPTTSI